jgi:hypothetical protein
MQARPCRVTGTARNPEEWKGSYSKADISTPDEQPVEKFGKEANYELVRQLITKQL